MFPAKPNPPQEPTMTLVKEELIESLYNKAEVSKHKSRVLVDAIFEHIKESLESGDDALISSFGKFSVKKAPRKGRNPATGGHITLDARRVVTFRGSPVLRDKIDGFVTKSPKSSLPRAGSPEALEKTGFLPPRE
jgi:integration host factor subunit alpha